MPKGDTSRPYNANLKFISKGGPSSKQAAEDLSVAKESVRKTKNKLSEIDRTLNVTVNDAKGLRKQPRY